MNKKILLVGESSFIVTSIKQAIEAEEYEVEAVLPKIADLSDIKEKPAIVIIYAGEYVKDETNVLVYLKDYCVENELQLGILGYKDEYDEILKVFDEEMIWTFFERPFNVKDLVEKLNEKMVFLRDDIARKHVMVVDDSGTMLRAVKSWLSSKYKVTIASSAAMAISLLTNAKPDLILLDYEMPVCSGPQFLEMIRGEMNMADIPVMFLTAKNDKSSVERVLGLKPDGYLLKTMTQEQVIKTIDDFFEKRKAKN